MEISDTKATQGQSIRPSSFEFVTFSDVIGMYDASIKSKVMKHAMKDIGVTRRKPRKSRKRYFEFSLELLTQVDTLLPSPWVTEVCSGAIDPFIKFPSRIEG